MKIVKCDICEKELKDNEINERYSYDRILDLCEECYDIYEEADKEIADKRIELRKKYEKDIKEEIQKIFNKYKINIWED